ncbi:C-type lectin mosGCTL-7-like [Haematobia irritans]|uniref:C-type lectin mosGCTL-7-like n=1 Tax=Haematobia irritans TaxID=7368 RepID=UPI003F50C416
MSLLLKVVILFGIIGSMQAENLEKNNVTLIAGWGRLLEPTTILGEKEYYVVSDQKANWHGAAEYCARKNMSLASIESDDEYKKLRNYLFNKNVLGKGYWLSGSNLADPSMYTWSSTGKSISTFNRWLKNEPRKGVNCLFTSYQFNWYTTRCTDQHYFICSRPLEPICGANGSCIFPNIY